jgi:hypothetical protein
MGLPITTGLPRMTLNPPDGCGGRSPAVKRG